MSKSTSLGNRTFQGFGLHPEVARRLDDLVKDIASLKQQMATQAATTSTTPTTTSTAATKTT
jgi:hypothetical protein